MDTQNQIPDNQQLILKEKIDQVQEVTDKELIEYLNGLQKQQLQSTQGSKLEIPPLTTQTYRSVLKKHDVRDKVIERVLKCIVNNPGDDINIFNRVFQNTANSTIQVDPESTQASKDTVTIGDVSPYVLSTHDKLVIRLYRKHGIYDIVMYNRSKEKFSFLIFPMKGQMMEMSIPVRQHTPLDTKSLSTTKINIRHVIGILLASIIKNVT